MGKLNKKVGNELLLSYLKTLSIKPSYKKAHVLTTTPNRLKIRRLAKYIMMNSMAYYNDFDSRLKHRHVRFLLFFSAGFSGTPMMVNNFCGRIVEPGGARLVCYDLLEWGMVEVCYEGKNSKRWYCITSEGDRALGSYMGNLEKSVDRAVRTYMKRMRELGGG